MKILSLTLAFLISFSAFSTTLQELNIPLETAHEVVASEIGNENTCMDEYLNREAELRKFLIWAPPVAIVGAPLGFYVTAQAVGGIASLLGYGGWGVLGAMIMGGMTVGAGIAGTFIVLETARGIEFAGNRKMMKLIITSQNNDLENKTTQKFLKKYRKQYPDDTHLTDQDLLNSIRNLDEAGKLCDGSVSGKSKKTRHLLAKRKHLIRFIHENN